MGSTPEGATRVLVTGAKGFIGSNLVVALDRRGVEVTEIDVDSTPDRLRDGLRGAAAVFHLAGVNRPEREEDFTTGNEGSTRDVCDTLARLGRTPLLVLSSSTQAALDNPYGRSKRAAEEVAQEFARATGAPVRVFRLPGVFGKWCRPNYNSVVATFCHAIAHGEEITISDPAREVELVHVVDVVAAFVGLLDGRDPPVKDGLCVVEPVTRITLGRLAELVRSFRAGRENAEAPPVDCRFTRLLYSTYLSYLPVDRLAYDLAQRTDPRGELAELLRSPAFGQIFVSRTRPGITRGHHYHDAKVEKFVVVEGEAVVRFRSILGHQVVEYPVTGRDFRVVDIPPGYTHSISNLGDGDLVVLFWASEPFDPEHPDTYFCEV